MANSTEKQVRKALRRMVFWRIAGELLRIPAAFLNALSIFFQVLVQWISSVEVAIFYFELDAARRYKLLTGVDPAAASGAPARYAMALHPDLSDDIQRSYLDPEHRSE